jgi:hypothetical protein
MAAFFSRQESQSTREFQRKEGSNMNHSHTFTWKHVARVLIVAFLATVLLGCGAAVAQNPQMEEKLMAIHQAQVANKQKLAQYTWQETETISVKGEVKDTKTYQVQMVNGQQQKTLVNNEQAQAGGGGRLKERIIDKKKEGERYLNPILPARVAHGKLLE